MNQLACTHACVSFYYFDVLKAEQGAAKPFLY